MRSARTRKQSGIAIFVSCIILVLAIPMCGLAVDATLLYVIKCRLQGAVDGAALAAAQGLARGTTDAAQITAAQNGAATYVMLNFPASYFFTTNVTCNPTSNVTIDETVAHQRTITVTASATVPTLFMHWFNINSTVVNASAETVRRDVNIAMVVDRSGSLAASGSCQAVIQSAINFTNKFSNGRDYIGLVTFASSTNADFPIADNFQTATPSVVTQIGAINCAGSTSSAMALWEGYDQLVGLNQSAALNVILFFTDGKPTGVNVNMPLANTSPCTSPHPPVVVGGPKWVNGLYNTYTNTDQFFGVLNPTNPGSPPSGDMALTTDSSNGAGCNFVSNVTDTSDFQGVPAIDVFGDNLNDGYQAISPNPSPYISFATLSNASAMAMNGADDAATQIRNGNVLCGNAPVPVSGCSSLLTHAGSLSNVIIYSIGLGNAPYPLSPDLLERISNDPRSPIYNSAQPTGAYIAAPTSADIDAAFALVASEITRLAK
jgi:Flp pilus assembly protein TadG